MKKVFLLFLISLSVTYGFSQEAEVQEELTDVLNTDSDSVVVQVLKSEYLTSFWDFMIASEEPSKNVIRLLKDLDPDRKYYSWEEDTDGGYYFLYDLTK